MKKISILILIVIILNCLSSCSMYREEPDILYFEDQEQKIEAYIDEGYFPVHLPDDEIYKAVEFLKKCPDVMENNIDISKYYKMVYAIDNDESGRSVTIHAVRSHNVVFGGGLEQGFFIAINLDSGVCHHFEPNKDV